MSFGYFVWWVEWVHFLFFYINQRISTYLDFFTFRMVANMEKWRDEWVADVKPSDEELAPKNADISKLLGCRVYGGLRLRNGRDRKSVV